MSPRMRGRLWKSSQCQRVRGKTWPWSCGTSWGTWHVAVASTTQLSHNQCQEPLHGCLLNLLTPWKTHPSCMQTIMKQQSRTTPSAPMTQPTRRGTGCEEKEKNGAPRNRGIGHHAVHWESSACSTNQCAMMPNTMWNAYNNMWQVTGPCAAGRV